MTRLTSERLAGIRALVACDGTGYGIALLDEIDALTADRDAAIKSSWEVGASWEEAREAIATLTAERDEARQIAKKLRQYIPDDDGSITCDFKMDAWRRPHSQAKGWPGCGWCPDHTANGTCTVCGTVRT